MERGQAGNAAVC